MSRALPILAAASLVVATPPARAAIVINEIMYNSPGSTDVEYVELYNTGPAAQNLAGWTMLDDDSGHTPCPLSGTLPAGGYLVVVGKISLYLSTYPGQGPINTTPFDSDTPGVGFALGNDADTVRLFNQAGALVDSVPYGTDGAWPSAPDGGGPSLELVNPGLDNAQPASWAASVDPPPGGTPGQQNSVFVADPAPQVGSVTRTPALPQAGQVVTVTAAASDAGLVAVELWVDSGSGYAVQPMFDDGLHGDGAAGNGVWGTAIAAQPSGTVVRYYVEATDNLAQSATAPPGAPADPFAYTVDHELPDLEISEILAANTSGLTDEAGDAEDWLEIRNRGPAVVELGGMFLAESLTDSQAWPLPAHSLGPGQRLLVWCDLEPHEGPLHATFRLAAEGGEVALFDSIVHGNLRIHGFTYGMQSDDVSFGYWPADADAPEYLVPPTPGAPNSTAGPFSPIVINEFLAGSALPGHEDWIELLNRSGAPVDIGGWRLTDGGAGNLYTFPSPTVIVPGGHLSLGESVLGFALALDGGDALTLLGANGLTGRDYFDMTAQSPDVSQGRFPDGTANWHLFSPSTRDLANACGSGLQPLGPVTGLRFESATALGWAGIAQATAYDVLRGDLATLRASGDFSEAGVTCLENNGADPESWAGETPPAGAARFYLVRGVNFACRFGTYDSGGPGEAGPRDAELAEAPSACP
jgi:hypothetical protein